MRKRPAPRHMVGTAPSRHDPARVAPNPSAPARLAPKSSRLAPNGPETAVDADEIEVTPVARVQRSRLAFAMAITLAALPVIVLDNLPATAETNEAHVEVYGTEADSSSSSERVTLASAAPSTTTSTTAAPTTSTAPPETTTTEAPATTEAPEVQALQAPAPTSTAPPATAPPSTAPPPSPNGADPNDPATWERLAQCESGGRWTLNSGNGYYGGLQFSLATWRNVGGAGYPHQATKAEQIKRGKILQAEAGWGQWPHCANKLGYT